MRSIREKTKGETVASVDSRRHLQRAAFGSRRMAGKGLGQGTLEYGRQTAAQALGAMTLESNGARPARQPAAEGLADGLLRRPEGRGTSGDGVKERSLLGMEGVLDDERVQVLRRLGVDADARAPARRGGHGVEDLVGQTDCAGFTATHDRARRTGLGALDAHVGHAQTKPLPQAHRILGGDAPQHPAGRRHRGVG